jgi:hypothetical protein
MTPKKFRLRIYHDHLSEGVRASLPPAQRVVYCVAGNATVTAAGSERHLEADGAAFGDREMTLRGEVEGARLWRWELVAPEEGAGEVRVEAIRSRLEGDYPIEIDATVPRLMRLDRVSFPLGGEALTHIHAAPGVRCLLSGNLLLDSVGHRYRVWPGDSWVEHGPDQVYAKASEQELTAFVRVMIVPESYRGRSTITYVRPEDQDKPKSQSYKRYLEEPIALQALIVCPKAAGRWGPAQEGSDDVRLPSREKSKAQGSTG